MPAPSQSSARPVAAGLAAYLERRFAVDRLQAETPLPPPDEPFVSIWQEWAAEARDMGAWKVLASRLPQLAFPVRPGMSGTEAYQAATRKGVPPGETGEATGLAVPRPDAVELSIHPSPAGRLPVITIRDRDTFVLVLQALARRNEPVDVPASQGASMVAGYNNWERIRSHRRRWEAQPADERETTTWSEEMARLVPRRELYQDRFLILSDGPYSGVAAADLGLDETAWREMSLTIRREHECTHYFTRRLFGSMENHLLDELLADWAGLTAATGTYRADWFLRFLGLEEHPRFRPGGRLEIYRGKPPLADRDFAHLQDLAVRSAATLERLERRRPVGPDIADRARRLAALAALSLPELAAEDAVDRLVS